jgi:hypothetical protein
MALGGIGFGIHFNGWAERVSKDALEFEFNFKGPFDLGMDLSLGL